MAYKTVTDLSTDITISLGGTNRKTGKKNPTSIEGYYLGRREVPDTKKNSGVSYIYTFQTPKGNVGVWGKTDLDRKMQGVNPGTMVRASFDKMVPTSKGEMYKFKVEVDADNTVEVVGSTETASSWSEDSSSDNQYTGSSSSDLDTAEEEDTVDEDFAQALAASERKAKLTALLNSKGKSKN